MLTEAVVEQTKRQARKAADDSEACYVQAPSGFGDWSQERQMVFIAELMRLGRIRVAVRKVRDGK